jgi:hypothetical protein
MDLKPVEAILAEIGPAVRPARRAVPVVAGRMPGAAAGIRAAALQTLG